MSKELKNNILISIIVPIYKVPENYLKACIESLITQSLHDIEIILVDDGSPDNCGEICEAYKKEDKRIIVVHKKNGGLCSARNAGYKAASGKWIMFVDGDDWIEKETCEEMFSSGEKYHVDMVMCGTYRDFTNSRTPLKYKLEPDKVYDMNGCRILQESLLDFNCNIGDVPAKLFRKSVLDRASLLHKEELKQGVEGLEYNLRVFGEISSAVYINSYFYHYIYNDKSISTSHDEENYKCILKGFKEIKDYIDKAENCGRLTEMMNNRLLYVVVTTAISGYFNPDNTESFKKKKEKFIQFLSDPIVHSAMEINNTDGLSISRKIIIYCIRHNIYIPMQILAIIRKIQKKYF